MSLLFQVRGRGGQKEYVSEERRMEGEKWSEFSSCKRKEEPLQDALEATNVANSHILTHTHTHTHTRIHTRASKAKKMMEKNEI